MTVIPKVHFQNLHHCCYCCHLPGRRRHLLIHSHVPREKHPIKACSVYVSEYHNTNLTFNLKNAGK